MIRTQNRALRNLDHRLDGGYLGGLLDGSCPQSFVIILNECLLMYSATKLMSERNLWRACFLYLVGYGLGEWEYE
jgi:hypothetical protein